MSNQNTSFFSVTPSAGLVINAPEWFADPDFQSWLNAPNNVVFTWHTKGDEPGDFSDTVLLIDPSLNGEGPESDMPEHIWNQIMEICRERFSANQVPTHIFVRLTNLGEVEAGKDTDLPATNESDDQTSHFVAIYSANEAATLDGRGYWNIYSGWTTEGEATRFTREQAAGYALPQSLGQDRQWVEIARQQG